MTPRVVMKFGGTSLGTADAMGRACDHVLREERESLVVVSAVGAGLREDTSLLARIFQALYRDLFETA